MTRHQFIFLILLYLLMQLPHPSSCQYSIFEHNESVALVQQAIDSIYNLNFEAADPIIEQLEAELGEYPGVLLLKAFYLRWKHQPVKKDHPAFNEFENYLDLGIAKCEEMLEENEDDVEAHFFLMACHAYLAELYVNNGQNFKALGQAKSAYRYIKIGFDLMEEIPEFYFSSGIYNYYREKFPEENPFYKSFIWFFRSGDMQEGLRMLKKGSELALFTRAECFTYLFHINLRYEDKPAAALTYSKHLVTRYPDNLYYVANYTENLIRLRQYDGILPYITQMLESEKEFYQYVGQIFYASYLELVKNNEEGAITYYKLADETGGNSDTRIPHYDSMLFLGMGRINKTMGNDDLSRQYLRKSIKNAEYIAYRKDAEKLLNN